jgi:RNA polymerase sigma factor (sigma-70 family)
MHPRSGLINLFSTFWQFDADSSGRWVADRRLRRNMESALEQVKQPTSESFWMLHWYKQWRAQVHPSAIAHLTAYVQETCYWVAYQLKDGSPTQQSVEDLFQTAIAQVEKVIGGFNPDLSASLKSYADYRFTSVLQTALRQQKEVSFYSDWYLLCAVSKKRLVESLQQLGESLITIQAYVLAWRCFQEYYVPQAVKKAGKLVPPSDEIWQAIATAYNAERIGQLGANSRVLKAVTLEKQLLYCAQAIRAYQLPKIISADTPNSDEDECGCLDHYVSDEAQTGIAELVAEEEAARRSGQRSQIINVLQTAIAELDESGRSLLQLYYQQRLTQQEIAQNMGIQQYAVSRQLARVRKKLLLALADWSQQTLHIQLTSIGLGDMGDVLEEWLRLYYHAEP